MKVYTAPGLYYEKQDKAGRGIAAIRTDIVGFVGLTEKGPVNDPVCIESWRQFESIFGGFLPYGYLAYSVYGFFENGGVSCYVVRVATMGSENGAQKASCRLQLGDGLPVMEIEALNEGKWGNRIRARLKRKSDRHFDMIVMAKGGYKEKYKGLSLDRKDKDDKDNTRYFAKRKEDAGEKVINGRSALIKIKEPNGSVAPETRVIDCSRGAEHLIRLENGKDGTDAMDLARELTGRPDDDKKRGLRCLEEVDEVSIICIPDIMIRPVEMRKTYEEPGEEKVKDPCLPPFDEKPAPGADEASGEGPAVPASPPALSEDKIRAVQQAMIEHCEKMKDRIAILDAPISKNLSGILGWRENFDSKYAALYYPWIRVDDSLKINNGLMKLVPPCGHVAGIFARNDIERGVHKAPANEEVAGAKDVEFNIESNEQEILNPKGINCIRVFPGRGIMVWGARTVSSDKSWRFVNVRRLMMMIEESVETSMQWSVFESNDYYLRMGIKVCVSSFLEELWRQGALAGSVPEGEAFFVRCDEDNNPQEIIDKGMLVADIGVAPSVPAEFVIFRVGRVDDRIKVMEEA